MLLDDNKNILFGKLVGLINGLYDEKESLDQIKDDIYDSLKALKEYKNIEIMINKLVIDKKKYLPNCLTCVSPCGRTNDYFINDCDDKDEKIKRLNQLLGNYESYDYRTLQKEIIKVTF